MKISFMSLLLAMALGVMIASGCASSQGGYKECMERCRAEMKKCLNMGKTPDQCLELRNVCVHQCRGKYKR